MILDRLYRILLRFLPKEFDGQDREEFWETYVARIQEARATGRTAGTRGRWRELGDLLLVVVRGRLGRSRDHRAGLQGAAPDSTDRKGLAHLGESLGQDVRVGARAIRRSPLATALAAGSLALGVGATTAIFSALDVWLIRPLPLPNAERLVGVGMANYEEGWNNNAFSIPDYADWAREAESVRLAAYARGSFNFSSSQHVERVQGLLASTNIFDVLGIPLVLGRGFSAEDGEWDASLVAVVSHGFWQTALGGSRSAVGSTIVLDGAPHTLVGVAAAGHEIPGLRSDVWRPLRISGEERRGGHFLAGVGLLAPGVGLSAAREELDAVAARVAELDPDRTFPDANVRAYRDAIYGSEFQQGGVVMAAAALFVLLIACANIANILLARGVARGHEMAVRGSLGAGRKRLVQQLLVESLLIAALGGLLGIVAGRVGMELLTRFALPVDVPGAGEIALNGRILVLSAGTTLASTLLFGLFPALRTSKAGLGTRLSDGGRGGPGRSGRVGQALVVAEISSALVLAALAGLMIKSMSLARSVDLGMDFDDALVFRLALPAATHSSPEQVVRFYEELDERLNALPGVTGVTASSGAFASGWSTVLYSIPGIQSEAGRSRTSAETRRVLPSYRATLGVELQAGRWLDGELDVGTSTPVAVIGRVLSDRWWPTPSEALGETVRLGDDEMQIVGVVDAGRLRGPHSDPPPVIFQSFFQNPNRQMFWMVRTSAGSSTLMSQIRGLITELDPNLAVFDAKTSREMLDETLEPQHAAVRILGALGVLALALTLIGVYGVVAHSVGQRNHEMGVRMVLGADRGGLIRLVLRGSILVASIGTGVGVLLALFAGRGLSFLLYDVTPRDPAVLAAVAGLLLAATLIASLVPALRAARVDPVETLRGE